jgi:hypothetical protein
MWRALLGIERQTLAERRAASNGTNLFFGALIGANLGALERLAIDDYLLLILVVALIVLYLQLAPVARRRWQRLFELLAATGGLYFLLMTEAGLAVFESDPKPGPHLFYTIPLWLVSLLMIELRPVERSARS